MYADFVDTLYTNPFFPRKEQSFMDKQPHCPAVCVTLTFKLTNT